MRSTIAGDKSAGREIGGRQAFASASLITMVAISVMMHISLRTQDRGPAVPSFAGTRPKRRSSPVCATKNDPLLLRVARGEEAERTPVWLMRQAGRYMADFRKFSERYPFRMRSETPDIAVELSLQPLHAFQTDGVIMFSDILTPLPAMGIEFDVIKGTGPRIEQPIREEEDLKRLLPLHDPSEKLGFVGETLSKLRAELSQTDAALIGFIGTPWTLAAYCVEGKATRNCLSTKMLMRHRPEILHRLLQHLTDSLIQHVHYQIESGAQIIQLFDSWAHHLSPEQFRLFSLPYAESIIRAVKESHSDVPVIFHMNGGTGKLELMYQCSADVIGLDWHTEMHRARTILADRVLQGNVDPLELCGTEASVREAVETCLSQAGGRRHILNLGHGVVQQTPEEHVRLFCELARNTASAVASLP